MPLPVQTKQPGEVCEEVKGGNGCLCAINIGKFWITMLSRVPQIGQVSRADNLISCLRSLHWLLAASFLAFIMLLPWTPKAIVIISYEVKFK